MKFSIALVFGATLALALGSLAVDVNKEPPETVVFESKIGTVTYDHAKHLSRVKAEEKDCTTCHDGFFTQEQKPLPDYGRSMHRIAESKKTQCAGCHYPGGAAFATQGKCEECHKK